MIVRLTQIDLLAAERLAGWPLRGPEGPLDYAFPDGTLVLEVQVLAQDERGQPLEESFRRTQVRRLIPQVIGALLREGEELVARLDGPLVAGELLAAFRHLADGPGKGPFAFAAARRLEDSAPSAVGSVRVAGADARLVAMCSDGELGLERSVRLRAFTLPPELVGPVLDADETGDERWEQALPSAGFVLSTMRGLRGLQVFTRAYTAEQARESLMRRLLGGGGRET